VTRDDDDDDDDNNNNNGINKNINNKKNMGMQESFHYSVCEREHDVVSLVLRRYFYAFDKISFSLRNFLWIL